MMKNVRTNAAKFQIPVVLTMINRDPSKALKIGTCLNLGPVLPGPFLFKFVIISQIILLSLVQAVFHESSTLKKKKMKSKEICSKKCFSVDLEVGAFMIIFLILSVIKYHTN